MEQNLFILTGPTAAGKTKLSIALAKALNGEIISADSMQVYRGMDIGTDKIQPEAMQGVPHHLIDVLDPAEEFNVYTFQQMALEKIDEIASRGHLPMIVGGTGFYIRAVLYHTAFSEAEDDGSFRLALEERARTGGEEALQALHAELAAIDPLSAERIHAHNVKRVIRALEYHHQTGEPISAHNDRERERKPAFRFLYYVLTDDRQKLYERIDRRVDEMMAEGLEAEVRGLLDGGLTGEEPAMQGLGYRQMADYISGMIPREEAVRRIKRDTRHYAKRQLTWFHREQEVRFIDRREYADEAAIAAVMTAAAKETFFYDT